MPNAWHTESRDSELKSPPTASECTRNEGSRNNPHRAISRGKIKGWLPRSLGYDAATHKENEKKTSL